MNGKDQRRTLILRHISSSSNSRSHQEQVMILFPSSSCAENLGWHSGSLLDIQSGPGHENAAGICFSPGSTRVLRIFWPSSSLKVASGARSAIEAFTCGGRWTPSKTMTSLRPMPRDSILCAKIAGRSELANAHMRKTMMSPRPWGKWSMTVPESMGLKILYCFLFRRSDIR